MPYATAIGITLQLMEPTWCSGSIAGIGFDGPSGRSALQTDLGKSDNTCEIDFELSQNKILWIQLNAPSSSGLSPSEWRRLDSGPVTAMVYGFVVPLEPLGTRGYMPFVTCQRGTMRAICDRISLLEAN